MQSPSRGLLVSSFVFAVALRAGHAMVTNPMMASRGDNTFFVAMARSVATGHAGRLPTLTGTDALAVKFPPLWPWVLGSGQRLLWFLSPDTANVTTSALVGAAGAPLAAMLTYGLLDRMAAPARTWLAGSVAVLYGAHPLLLGATTSLMSEALTVPLSLAVLLAIDRVVRRGATTARLATVGILIALSALLRPESVALWGVGLAVVAALSRSWRSLVVPLAVAAVPVLAYAAVASVAAQTLVPVSTNGASAVAGANCDAAWSGDGIGYWSKECLDEVWLGRIPPSRRRVVYAYEQLPADRFPAQLSPRIEGELQDAQRRGAGYAIRNDPAAVLGAIPFRVARGFGVWWSPEQTRAEVGEGRIEGWEVAGRVVHLVLVLPFAAIAMFAMLKRRSRLGAALDRCVDRSRLLPWVGIGAMWVLGLMATHGSARHRSQVDALFLVGAAIGLATLVTAARARREDPERERADPRPTEMSGALSGCAGGRVHARR